MTNDPLHSCTGGGWIGQWLDAARSDQYELDIEFLKYQEVTGDLVKTLRRMFTDHFDAGMEHKAVEFLNRCESGEVGRRNLRKGVGREWRTTLSESVRLEAWNCIDDNVKDFLRLTA